MATGRGMASAKAGRRGMARDKARAQGFGNVVGLCRRGMVQGYGYGYGLGLWLCSRAGAVA